MAASPGAAPAASPADPARPPRRRVNWALRIGGWALALLGVAVGVGMLGQFAFYRFTRSMTDDAFVESHIVHLSPEVPGLLTGVRVEEHDQVRAGQVLAELDPAPQRRELELARARRAVAEATLAWETASLERLEKEHPRRVAVAEKELALAEAELEQARAQLKLTTEDVEKAIQEAGAEEAAARAVLTRAEADYERYRKLFERRTIPERQFQDVTRDYQQARAEHDAAQAKLARARVSRRQAEIESLNVTRKLRARDRARENLRLAQLGELEVEEERRQVEYRRSQVEQAARDVETVRTQWQYTRIVAPFDGVVVRRFRNPGDHAPVGSPVLSMYDPELVYVTAYLEEERLEGVVPGNPVTIWVEAISDPLHGRVVWIERATGANFALVPRDVSSGEFTRVTQRVPVRIAVARDRHWSELRPGLSATVAIAHGPGDPAWAEREAERQRRRAAEGASPIDLPAAAGDSR